MVRVLELPSAVVVALRLEDANRLGHALVGRDAGIPQVIKRAEGVVVPGVREGEVGRSAAAR